LAAQTLTFLFTDVEGSTALLTRLGGGYAEVLADHHGLIRASLAAHGGEEVDTQGDAFFAVFSSPSACAAAAIDMQRARLMVCRQDSRHCARWTTRSYGTTSPHSVQLHRP
jgi:class 3 adenylate cyclase